MSCTRHSSLDSPETHPSHCLGRADGNHLSRPGVLSYGAADRPVVDGACEAAVSDGSVPAERIAERRGAGGAKGLLRKWILFVDDHVLWDVGI